MPRLTVGHGCRPRRIAVMAVIGPVGYHRYAVMESIKKGVTQRGR